MNAFKAPYEQTNTGVILIIPVAAAMIARTGLNLDYENDGEVGPFFDAVEEELGYNSDDDVELEMNDEAENTWPEPPAQATATTVYMPVTEEQLMLLSNSELKAELRKRNLSASGNKTTLVHRLLTATVMEPLPPPPPMEQNTTETETPPVKANNHPPATGPMTAQLLALLSNAALRDIIKQQNQSTNGHKQVLIERLLSGEPRQPVTRNRNNNTEEDDMEGQLSGFPPGVRWGELVPLPKSIPEVTPNGMRAPTVPENEMSAPKFNFGETFDCKPFTELCEVFKFANGKLVKDRRGKQVTESEIRHQGRANPDWLEKKKTHQRFFSRRLDWSTAAR